MKMASTVPARDGGPSSETLRTRLRDATRVAHVGVDAYFAHGLAAPGAYARYLRGMRRTLLAYEQAGHAWRTHPQWAEWVDPGRAALLDADLQALDLTPLPPAPVPEWRASGSVLGALYVIEGSAMGAQLLRRGVPAGAPAAFLDAHAGAAGRWPRLVALLGARPADDDDAGAACTSALGLFALADDSFRLAAGEPA